MNKITKPIIKKIVDNDFNLKKMENEFLNEKNKNYIIQYPVVYIHAWKNSNNMYEVYVGESNNIFDRTREHYNDGKIYGNWQVHINNDKSELYIIGHEHFNKSLTLDIENKLIHYLTGVDNVSKVHNARSNPQNQYYTSNEFDIIFNKIWKELRFDNEMLFPLESKVVDSSIFKSSPLHKLTYDQKMLKELIIDKIAETLVTEKKRQLIFIEGEAGTGKTVLNSSTFYELCCMKDAIIKDNKNTIEKKLNFYLLVNHNEQLNVYNNIFNKLCLNDNEKLVYKPTSFINKFNKRDDVDVVFIDEAHLLLTQGKQSYTGKNQLQDIMEISKVTIVMYDPNQVLSTEQYWEYKILNKYINKAKKSNTYRKLFKQLRIHANDTVLNWIDDFTINRVIKKLPTNLGNYDIKAFDTPLLLEKEIKRKAKNSKYCLSRMVATYDWPYNNNKYNNGKFWEVTIDNWHKPWNYQIAKNYTTIKNKKIKNLSWAEQPQTIDEIGSIFTIQGFDLNYVGVIIGPSVKYRNNKLIFCPENSCNDKATRNRKLMNGEYRKFGEKLLNNELRVLMTRGVNGLYIYACDQELREHLKKCLGKKYIFK